MRTIFDAFQGKDEKYKTTLRLTSSLVCEQTSMWKTEKQREQKRKKKKRPMLSIRKIQLLNMVMPHIHSMSIRRLANVPEHKM